MKKCVDCGLEKEETDFSSRPNYGKTKTVYLKSQCKKCDIIRMNLWKEKNREKFNTYQKKYHKEYQKK